MDHLRLAYVWDLPAPARVAGARYAAAPNALPGFVPPKRGEAMWLPETSVPGVLEHLALTGLGLPARRWEQQVLHRQGTTGLRSTEYRVHECPSVPLPLVFLAMTGLGPAAAREVFATWDQPADAGPR